MADEQGKNKFGKLESVKIREGWPKEDQDFTPWLSQEENLNILSETLDMNLELVKREKRVGSFRADILCANVNDDDSLVLIENQFEKTDHKHLGQLITYAAGSDTVNIIWISETFTDEHRAALDWLNDITDDRFRFFGLEVELWKIGNSKPAPKFNIVSKPNDWSRSVKKNSGELSPTRTLQKEFWANFYNYLEEKDPQMSDRVVQPKQNNPRYYMNINIGKPVVQLTAWIYINKKDERVVVGFETYSQNCKELFDRLVAQKDDIEQELGFKPAWDSWRDGEQFHRIRYRKDAELGNKEEWDNYFEWILKHLGKFDKAFTPRV